jgi:hypothetical protein
MVLRLSGDGNIENLTLINTAISSTELGYLEGVSSSIQGQLNVIPEINSDSWLTYTPTWNVSIGNGTSVGNYIKIGKLVLFRAYLSYGSTTAAPSGNFVVSLPVSLASNQAAFMQVNALDAGSNYYKLNAFGAGIWGMGGTSGVVTSLSSTYPFTWATGDAVFATGFYEAA